jgi:metal-responsive CopG/Arc/MetJ family transcriptional regulator
MLYDHNMPAKPVQISLDIALLERIDADAETRAHGRSAFVRSAVEHYLRARQRAQVDKAIADAYGGNADRMRSEIADLMDVQVWPAD